MCIENIPYSHCMWQPPAVFKTVLLVLLLEYPTIQFRQIQKARLYSERNRV